MGRDDSPKRRHRKLLERKQEQRTSNDRILIVTEGSKTEPNYFKEIRTEYRLSNVVVVPSTQGTAPLQVVQCAQNLFEKGDLSRGIRPRDFERAFAVFDRDEHCGYSNALRQAKLLNSEYQQREDGTEDGTEVFQAITSVPCFELWLLLHYEDVHAPLSCGEVMDRLRKHFPDYDKSMRNVFRTTCKQLEDAIRRAETLNARPRADNDSEPFTAVVDLVKMLTTQRG